MGLRRIALFVGGLGLLVGGQTFAASPNIVLILTDDQGWSQTDFAADPRVSESRSNYLETPNMRRFAEGGMRFTSGYSPAPLCTPTRRCIQCGTTAARSGSEFKSEWIPAEHLTIPKALKQADPNYRCAHFGKWGEQMISTPEECGYDVSDGMTGNNTGGMPSTLGEEDHDSGPAHFIDDLDPKRTRTVTDRAIAFMGEQSRAGKPFFVQISYYAQHLSVVCTQQMLAKYKAKGEPDRGYTQAWAAMMEELDAGIGRVLNTVDENNLGDTTFLFLTADNGGRGSVPGGDGQALAPNHPLTGAKHSLWEGGVRVPFLARGPSIAAGGVCHVPVVGYDFLPTFYDLAGGQKPLTDEVDGVSFRPLLADPQGSLPNRPAGGLVFHRPGRSYSAIRSGDEKLMLFWKPNGEVRTVDLYDVGSDPREEGHEITSRRPEQTQELQQRLLGYLNSVDAETAGQKPAKQGKQTRSNRPRNP